MSVRTSTGRWQGLTLLAAASVIAAVACAIAGIVVLNIGHPSDDPTEVGKWLLQISALFAGTGALSAAFRQADTARAARVTWAALLQDLIAAHDVAQLSSRLLTAHGTARTYREQMTRIHEVRREQYLAVARQQRLDEAVLTYRLGKVVEAAGVGAFPVLPPDLALPLPAGLTLSDATKFPRLADFRDHYDESEFRAAYERAKDAFQHRAGIRR